MKKREESLKSRANRVKVKLGVLKDETRAARANIRKLRELNRLLEEDGRLLAEIENKTRKRDPN